MLLNWTMCCRSTRPRLHQTFSELSGSPTADRGLSGVPCRPRVCILHSAKDLGGSLRESLHAQNLPNTFRNSSERAGSWAKLLLTATAQGASSKQFRTMQRAS